MPPPTQPSLFCRCGAGPAVAGLCRRCYRQAARSRCRFGGHRESVLARDGYAAKAAGRRFSTPSITANPAGTPPPG